MLAHILYGIHWLSLLHLTLSFRWCSLNPNFTVSKLPIVKWINQTRSSDFRFVWLDRHIYLLSVNNRILPGGGCYLSSVVCRLIVLVWYSIGYNPSILLYIPQTLIAIFPRWPRSYINGQSTVGMRSVAPVWRLYALFGESWPNMTWYNWESFKMACKINICGLCYEYQSGLNFCHCEASSLE